MGGRRWADDEILDAIRRVAATVDGPLRVRDYEQRRTNREPSVSVIHRRFTGWAPAVVAAGLEHRLAQPGWAAPRGRPR